MGAVMLTLPPIPSWQAIHPLVVHFPIALLLIAPVFILIGIALKPERRFPFLLVALILMALGTLRHICGRIKRQSSRRTSGEHAPSGGCVGATPKSRGDNGASILSAHGHLRGHCFRAPFAEARADPRDLAHPSLGVSIVLRYWRCLTCEHRASRRPAGSRIWRPGQGTAGESSTDDCGCGNSRARVTTLCPS